MTISLKRPNHECCGAKGIPRGETDIARIFARVFEEHFTSVDSKIVVKSSEELHSGCLQSPDDEEATYRKKRGVGYRGLLTATETCNPENEVQLITDIHVTANNRDDSDDFGPLAPHR